MKLMSGCLQGQRTRNSILRILVLIILLLPVVQANYLKEVKEKAIELETPKAIYQYLWKSNIYEYHYTKKPLSIYWEDRIGDCTEVARIQYIMYRAIGLQARISHGIQKGEKHDYVEYLEEGKWKSFERNITREGRGIW